MASSKKKAARSGDGVVDGRKPRKPAGHKPAGKARSDWERALWRYLAVCSVLGVMWLIYNLHPYYERTGPNFRYAWRPWFNGGATVWLVLGIPYVKLTLEKFGGRRMDLTDGAVHYLLAMRGLSDWAFEGCRFPRHILGNRRMRNTLLSLGVKSFFTPLMACFFAEHANNIRNIWFNHKGIPIPTQEQINEIVANGRDALLAYMADLAPRLLPTWDGMVDGLTRPWARQDYKWFLNLYYQLLFFTDTMLALIGYSMESRWLGNKTKSVEPTGFGWMAALMCYPPFNDVSGTYFPLGMNHQNMIINDDGIALLFQALTCAAFTVYVAATVAFGFTFSNLTNRGIITRGPYAYIRHPAYVAKNFAWWLEYLPYMGNFANVIPLLCWNVIYGLRAWTEERHLSKDPDYVAYKKKVPWVALPGIV